MRKLIILLVFIAMIIGVYYAFDFIKDKKEEEVKNNQMSNDPVKKSVDVIDQSLQPHCTAFINSVNYQIMLNSMNSEMPKAITDPEYVSSRVKPESVYLEIDDGGVTKGTITYENVVCKYNNGEATIEKKN